MNPKKMYREIDSSISVKRDARKRIDIVLPCYNEQENIEALYVALCDITDQQQYDFRFLFIDNASTDATPSIIEEIATKDARVGAIVNGRNFGFSRSPFYGLTQSDADCVILMATDLQDPPSLIFDFIEHWEKGAEVILGQKTSSDESKIMYGMRSGFYFLMNKMSDFHLIRHVTGFGLYDRRIIEIFKQVNDPIPYTRGLITELGLSHVVVPFNQPARKKGKTKFNFLGLYDLAMVAVTSYAKTPMRAATFTGFLMAAFSFLLAMVFLITKVFIWDGFPAGYSSVIVSVLFLSSLQIFMLGILGEYILALLAYAKGRPLVIEKKRIGNWN